jgi:exosortase family protein XrtM
MNSRLLVGILFPLGFLAVSTFIGFLFEHISENTLRRVYLDQIAIISGQIINLLTPHEHVFVLQNTLHGKAHLEIAPTCSGLGFLDLLGAAIMVFPTSIRNKLTGLIFAIILVALINLGRIIGLYYTMAYLSDWFLWLHLYVAPTLMIILFCLYFAGWTFWTAGKRHD